MGQLEFSLGDIVAMEPFVAEVEIIDVNMRKCEAKIKVLHCFKGAIPTVAVLKWAPLWGKFSVSWFEVGERALILAGPDFLGDLLGRMPIFTIEGQEVIEAFVDGEGYFGEIPAIEDSDRHLALWKDVKHAIEQWTQ